MEESQKGLNQSAYDGTYSYDFWKDYLSVLDLEGRLKILTIEDEEGRLPLHMAVLGGRLDVVKDMLQFGSDINAKDHNGFSALHNAVSIGSEEIVGYLIEQGADIAATTNNDSTPLKLAQDANNSRLVEFLVSKGAK